MKQKNNFFLNFFKTLMKHKNKHTIISAILTKKNTQTNPLSQAFGYTILSQVKTKQKEG